MNLSIKGGVGEVGEGRRRSRKKVKQKKKKGGGAHYRSEFFLSITYSAHVIANFKFNAVIAYFTIIVVTNGLCTVYSYLRK